MPKPILKTTPVVAVSDKNDARVYLPGSNLDPKIGKLDVEVSYKNNNVGVKNAHVKSSVLILKLDKITRNDSQTGGEDEITVVVTNPGTSNPSDPVEVTVVFDDGN